MPRMPLPPALSTTSTSTSTLTSAISIEGETVPFSRFVLSFFCIFFLFPLLSAPPLRSTTSFSSTCSRAMWSRGHCACFSTAPLLVSGRSLSLSLPLSLPSLSVPLSLSLSPHPTLKVPSTRACSVSPLRCARQNQQKAERERLSALPSSSTFWFPSSSPSPSPPPSSISPSSTLRRLALALRLPVWLASPRFPSLPLVAAFRRPPLSLARARPLSSADRSLLTAPALDALPVGAPQLPTCAPSFAVQPPFSASRREWQHSSGRSRADGNSPHTHPPPHRHCPATKTATTITR